MQYSNFNKKTNKKLLYFGLTLYSSSILIYYTLFYIHTIGGLLCCFKFVVDYSLVIAPLVASTLILSPSLTFEVISLTDTTTGVPRFIPAIAA